MFLSKFLIFSGCSVFICTVGNFVSKWSPFSFLDKNTLLKIHELTENLHEVALKPELASESLEGNPIYQPNLYSLFSTNVNTFSKQFKKHFYTWALFKWGDTLLSDGDSNASLNKSKIFKKFIELKNSYVLPEKFEAKNWNLNNYVISESLSTLEEIFKDVFFKEIYLVEKDGKKDIGIGENTSDQYGNGKFIKKVAEFQKFVFEEWLKEEKPILICKKSWDYSSSFSDSNKVFKNTSGNPGFKFPDFSTIKSEWQTFNKKIASGNASGNACEDSDYQFVTISDIADIKDGYELSAFLYRHGDDKPKYFVDSNNSNTFDSKDPIELFVQDSNSLATHANLFKFKLQEDTFDSTGPLKDHKDHAILTFRDFKYKNDDKNGYVTYARTNKGLLFLHKKPDHKDLKNYLFQDDKYKTHNLTNKLFEYFKKNGMELLGKNMSSDSGGIFFAKDWDVSLTDLAKDISLYSSILSENNKQWKILQTLSSAVKDFVDIKFSNSKPTNSGLAVPIQLKRNLDKSTEITNNSENNGKYEAVTTLFNSESNKENSKELKEYSQKIKKNINRYLNTISRQISIQKKKEGGISFFLNDYIFDSIYQDFVSDKSLLIKTIKNIYLLNELNINSLEPETIFSKFAELLSARFVGNESEKSTWKEFLEEGMVEIFLGTAYLSEIIEDRVNYGGYKWTAPEADKYCIKKISGESQSVPNSEQSSCTNVTTNSKQWQKKLKNYWYLKNYVYNGYGFDISSFETDKLIRFLFSLNKLLTKDFSEFKKIAISSINPKDFGVLAWVDTVDNSGEEIGKQSNNSIEKIEKIEKYFRNSREDLIFNPFFSNQIDIPTNDSRETSLYSNSISAFAPTDSNEKSEFFGFQGLVTKNTLESNFPKAIKEALFNAFEKHNPASNKNYVLENNNNNNGSSGIAFGLLGDKGEEIDWEKYIDDFKTNEQGLEMFLDKFLTSEKDSYKSTISDTEHTQASKELTFEDKKQLLKKQLENKKDQLAILTKRFSGFLQNGSTDDGIFKDKKFFIPKELNSNSGYVVYVTQVNRHDFSEGFENFVKIISYRTLFKTIMMICSKDIHNRKIMENHLLNKNVNL